jgi:Fe-S-cluster containining protein
MLTDDGLCSVYENRPLLCNLKLAALLLGYTNDDWMELQATECNSMIKEAGLDEKYKVMVDKF